MVIIGISLESTWIHPSGSYPGYSWIFRHSIWYSPNCPNSDSWRIHLFRQHRGGFCGAQLVFWYRVFINFMAQLLPCLSSHLWSSSASVCCRCQNPLHPTYTEAEQLFFGNLEQFIGLFLRTWRAIGVFVDILCWQLQQRDTSGTKNLRCSAPSAATTVAAFRCYFWLDTPVWQWLVDGICSPLIENLWLKTSFFFFPWTLKLVWLQGRFKIYSGYSSCKTCRVQIDCWNNCCRILERSHPTAVVDSPMASWKELVGWPCCDQQLSECP